jgi:hypothetical protein
MSTTRREVEFDKDSQSFVFECPHCNLMVQVFVNELNCRIFRHGMFKHNWEQVPPHLPKDVCDQLVAEDQVLGCCKPYQFFDGPPPFVDVCEYI